MCVELLNKSLNAVSEILIYIVFLENIWGIYILIKDKGNLDFQHIFHESWDYAEY